MFQLPPTSKHPWAVDIATEKFNPEAGEFGRQLRAHDEVAESVERCVGAMFQSRIAELQLADRQYWRDIIRELKELRAIGKLMTEGQNVSPTI